MSEMTFFSEGECVTRGLCFVYRHASHCVQINHLYPNSIRRIIVRELSFFLYQLKLCLLEPARLFQTKFLCVR